MVKLKSGERGIYNADAWLVLASECLSAFYTCSAKNGATVIENDGVASIDRKKRIVVTNSGVIVRKSLLYLCRCSLGQKGGEGEGGISGKLLCARVLVRMLYR